jgi:hypothetical protein
MIPTHPVRSAWLDFALHNLYGLRRSLRQGAQSTPPMLYAHGFVKQLLFKSAMSIKQNYLNDLMDVS